LNKCGCTAVQTHYNFTALDDFRKDFSAVTMGTAHENTLKLLVKVLLKEQSRIDQRNELIFKIVVANTLRQLHSFVLNRNFNFNLGFFNFAHTFTLPALVGLPIGKFVAYL